jgi:hypothetical protein
MYSTTVYLYQQITKVLCIETNGQYFTARYESVYAKKLTVNKGVDNVLLFEFINQEQKPVNITGSNFLFRLINQTGDEILIAKPMEVLNAATGRVKVTLTSEEITPILAQPASYSIEKTSAGLTTSVFVDAQAGARAPADIVDSILPQYIPSKKITIPTTDISAQIDYGGTGQEGYPYWNQAQVVSTYSPINSNEYFSSYIYPTGPVTTIQCDLREYSGTIKVQAAENYQSIWHNVTESTTYYNETETIHINVFGYHPLLRLGFNSSLWAAGAQPGYAATGNVQVSNGVITGVTITNPGFGYVAAPLVLFVGDGAGATAQATVSNGQISSITITNGGSGYWPIPPTGYSAGVIFLTGLVENILYR